MLRFEVHFDEDTADTFVATISVQPTEFFRDVSAALRTGDIDNLAL
ncbi:hypothetical protein HL669_22700 [Vibrio parahaemolyticus]|nr:hypothetical protein [Vibrio parahaemolyticus]NNU14415.1 hypothetical protein [Vibrio parahaemolyticus]